MVVGGILSFGHVNINKLTIKKDESLIIDRYSGEGLYRSPSLKLFKYKNNNLLACPGYPNQVHIIDADAMNLYKRIFLSKKHQEPDFSNGPIQYPPAIYDKTPFTVHSFDDSPYLFLTSLWNTMVFDFENEIKIASILYNIQADPIIALGHSASFKL